jgi:hypothetical protein
MDRRDAVLESWARAAFDRAMGSLENDRLAALVRARSAVRSASGRLTAPRPVRSGSTSARRPLMEQRLVSLFSE